MKKKLNFKKKTMRHVRSLFCHQPRKKNAENCRKKKHKTQNDEWHDVWSYSFKKKKKSREIIEIMHTLICTHMQAFKKKQNTHTHTRLSILGRNGKRVSRQILHATLIKTWRGKKVFFVCNLIRYYVVEWWYCCCDRTQMFQSSRWVILVLLYLSAFLCLKKINFLSFCVFIDFSSSSRLLFLGEK